VATVSFVPCKRDTFPHTLNDGIDNPLLLRAGAPCSQVSRDRLIDLDQAVFPVVDDVELVLVDKLVVARAQLPDRLIMLVQKRHMAMTVAIVGIVVALKAE